MVATEKLNEIMMRYNSPDTDYTDYRDFDLTYIGDETAFIAYYYMNPYVIFVYFMFNEKSFKGTKKNLNNIKELNKMRQDLIKSEGIEFIVLFQSKDQWSMNNHSEIVQIWSK